ncbi:YopX family protein [Pseudarthrobacter sp902506025]|uniref:YopX family protein n=1 Tax=Pseudarthrobacter sp. 902506025 TaxID=3155291 RepID=UPI00344F3ED8
MSAPLKFDYVYKNNDEAGTILHEVVTLDEIQTDEFVYELEIIARRLFTGLQDMTGADIFDGDYLEYVSPFEYEEPRRYLYVVEWVDFGFEARWINPPSANFRSDGHLSLQGADEDMRIIGNRFEHPDLLEARS